jgi:hypothetical protein
MEVCKATFISSVPQTSTSNSTPSQTQRNGTTTPGMMSPSSDTNKSSTPNNGATNKKRISENSCDGYFKRAKIGEEIGSQVSVIQLNLIS